MLLELDQQRWQKFNGNPLFAFILLKPNFPTEHQPVQILAVLRNNQETLHSRHWGHVEDTFGYSWVPQGYVCIYIYIYYFFYGCMSVSPLTSNLFVYVREQRAQPSEFAPEV